MIKYVDLATEPIAVGEVRELRVQAADPIQVSIKCFVYNHHRRGSQHARNVELSRLNQTKRCCFRRRLTSFVEAEALWSFLSAMPTATVRNSGLKSSDGKILQLVANP